MSDVDGPHGEDSATAPSATKAAGAVAGKAAAKLGGGGTVGSVMSAAASEGLSGGAKEGAKAAAKQGAKIAVKAVVEKALAGNPWVWAIVGILVVLLVYPAVMATAGVLTSAASMAIYKEQIRRAEQQNCLQNVAVDPGSGVGPLLNSDSAGVVVMTFNIRRSSLARPADYPGPAADYSWAVRGPHVAALIKSASPDVIGLQEVSDGQLADLKAMLPGWTFTEAKHGGIPIAWRSSRFSAVSSVKIDRINTRGKDGSTRNRYIRYVTLEDASNGDQFVLSNLHAEDSDTGDQARKAAWSRIKANLVKSRASGLPVLLTGDFNTYAGEGYSDYQYLLDGMNSIGMTDTGSTKAGGTRYVPVPDIVSYNGWGDSVPGSHGKKVYKVVNRASSGAGSWWMDYVWVSPGANTIAWQMVTPKISWTTVNGTPSVPVAENVPSDHWPIVAKVSLDDGTDAAPSTSTINTNASVDGYNKSQMEIAAKIVEAGRSLNLDDWTISVGIMTAIGESSLVNVAHGDAAGPDSRGIFQQRSGWGPLADRMDPFKAATAFFKALVKVRNYHSLEPTIAAHKTQINADPYHYAKFWTDATKIFAAISFDPSLSLLSSNAANCGNGTMSVPGGDVGSMITFALSYEGKYTYAWGGGGINGPSYGIDDVGRGIYDSRKFGFDCSGFVQFAVYQSMKLNIGGDSRSQAAWFAGKGMLTRTNDVSQLQPGDVVFYSRGSALSSIYHVAIVTEVGKQVESPGEGRPIQHNKISDRMPYDVWGYGRFTGAG